MKNIPISTIRQPETPCVYAVISSSTELRSRVFKLKDDLDIYSCIHKWDDSVEFSVSGKYEYQELYEHITNQFYREKAGYD